MNNIIKQKNNCFVKYMCKVCFDIFDGEEYVYETIGYNKELVCYRCAEEKEEEIIKRIDSYISDLRTSQEKLKNNYGKRTIE